MNEYKVKLKATLLVVSVFSCFILTAHSATAKQISQVVVRANRLRALGNVSGAIKVLEQGLRSNPNDQDILLSLGTLYKKSATPDFFLGRGQARTSKKDLAKDCFNKLLKLNPKNARAYTHLADIALFEDEYQKAISLVNKSLKIDPTVSLAYRVRGYSYLALGEPQKASSDLGRYLQTEDEFRTILTKAEIDEQLGNYQSAYKYYKLFLKKINQKRLLLISREVAKQKIAKCAAKIGKTKESLDILAALIRKDPKNSGAYLERARVYRQIKDNRKALYNYNKALSLKYSKKILAEKNALKQ